MGYSLKIRAEDGRVFDFTDNLGRPLGRALVVFLENFPYDKGIANQTEAESWGMEFYRRFGEDLYEKITEVYQAIQFEEDSKAVEFVSVIDIIDTTRRISYTLESIVSNRESPLEKDLLHEVGRCVRGLTFALEDLAHLGIAKFQLVLD